MHIARFHPSFASTIKTEKTAAFTVYSLEFFFYYHVKSFTLT